MKMVEKIKFFVAAAALATTVAIAPATYADDANPTNSQSRTATTMVCPANAKEHALEQVNSWADCGMEEENTLMSTLNTIINVAIGVIGFIAVVVIILGGVQYTTSAGEAGKVKKAKDTIMYGIIGLVIALLAYAIVNFILAGIFGAAA